MANVPLKLSILFRSFFLQAAWNLERMQNIGFLFALSPALKHIYGRKRKEFREACLRHLELFNSNPYMAGFILGAVANLEAERARDTVAVETLGDFKRGTMTAFAAMGDALFWSLLKPLCASAAIVFALGGKLWAPWVFLISYNAVHGLVRGYGLFSSFERGMRVLQLIQAWDIPGRVITLRKVLPVVLGAVAARCAVTGGEAFHGVFFWGSLPLIVLCYALIRRRVPIPLILGFTFVLMTAGTFFCSTW